MRSPWLTETYFKSPEKTEELWRSGWLHSGDIGQLDEDGYLYIVDRKKDMIIAGGFNVYPREVEAVLALCTGVDEAVVVGERDAAGAGHLVRAVVGAQSVHGRVLMVR